MPEIEYFGHGERVARLSIIEGDRTITLRIVTESGGKHAIELAKA